MKKNATAVSKKIEKKIVDKDTIEEKRTISFTQYSMFQECPHRWYLTYGKELYPFNSSIDTVFGTAFHETIQEYLNLLYNKSVKEADNFKMFSFLEERLIFNYTEEYKKNNNQHFTTPEIINEYYDDGCQILQYIKKHRKALFDIKNEEILGIEIPLLFPIDPMLEIFYFEGYLDIIIRDKVTKRVKIIDFKTSKNGWTDYQKKDDKKISQILLYKEFFANQYNIPKEIIDVCFFIVKRKIYENAKYPIPRVQQFVPANGKEKTKIAIVSLQKFIHECYQLDGSVVEKDYPKNPTACRFCPYKNRPDLCDQKNS